MAKIIEGATSAGTTDAAAQGRVEPVIIDLGKQKRKKIRRLRKGKGPLVDKVMQVHSEMQAQGLDMRGPIVIVVKAKKKKRRSGFGGMGAWGKMPRLF
jgi:hypothetical protein